MLLCRAGEVDLDLVSSDGDRCAYLELGAVGGLERVGSLEAAVRECRDRRADPALRVGVELVHGGLDSGSSAPLAELVEPVGCQPVGCELRAEIAAALVGVAHPCDKALEGGLVQSCGWDHDALLVQPARERPEDSRARRRRRRHGVRA